MEKYSIKVDKTNKKVDMMVSGSFEPEDVELFVKDYQTKVGSITANQYTLDVDCTTMNILTKDMVPSLENSFKMYNQSGFEKVLFTIKKSPVIKMQLKRIAKNAGLTNGEVVEIA
ncbi:hypothetical protein [Paraliobacillus sediminis]|uniref:hypothetical protein n=1 Tax=Paraliobacillus sediminis TaxID=1885916 RepID=UPI000E3D95A3|nr:hypothetical protein [Paraliobacillus sediminis]